MSLSSDILDLFKPEPKPASPHRGALLEKLPEWMRMSPFRRKYGEEGLDSYSESFKKDKDGVYRNAAGKEYKQVLESVPIEDALIVSSKTEGGHYVLLDIDFPVRVYESSTPGKHHIYIDKILTDDHMEKLLKVMVEVGLVNEGVYDLQWRSGKEVSLRLNWVKKGVDIPFSQMNEAEQVAVINEKPLNWIPTHNGSAYPPPGYYNHPVDGTSVDW